MTSLQPVPNKPPPPIAELRLFDTDHDTHALSRKTILGDGTYRIFLAIPRTAPPAAGFPILYLLDGNAVFDLLTSEQLASANGVILAGIGHDTDRRFDPPSRSRDYTPSFDKRAPFPDPDRPDRLIGGAEQFLRRLAGPLMKATEANAPVDPARRIIFGHSLAGMFALYAMLKIPGVFRRFFAASPSLWWGDEILLKMETQTPRSKVTSDVLITLGDSERRSSPRGPHWDGPAPHTLEMIRRLQDRENLNVASHIFKGLGHAATLEASIPLALEFSASG